jgi:branched-chain amino acid transport system substrate-binding protein
MKHCITLILSLILMAGCSAEPVLTPTNTPAPTMTSSPIPAKSTFTPSPLPPTETSTPFVPEATIKIFSQSALSGELSLGGTDVMRSARLAVEQMAGPLMDLGYKIELVSYDDQNDMGIAVAVAKEIIEDPDILCGVGPYASRILNQVKEIYHQEGLAFVSPSSTAAFATASGYLEVNRVVGRHDAQGAVGAQFAKAQGFSRVFIISQGTDYAQFNSYHFREEANRIGVEVAGNMTTDATNTFGKFINRIIEANPDVVYFSTLNVEQAGTFFREARAAGYMGAFLGNEGIDNPALLEFAGPLLTDGGGMYYTSIGAPANYYPGATGFLEDFETLYGVAPQIFAAQSYDAAGICMKAIEAASKTNGGEIPTRTEVANIIRALKDYKGITGVYNFDKNGDPDPAQYFVFQVVSPDPNHWDQNILITSFEVSPPK